MKLSVITINYNNRIGLDNTIKSVLSQTSNDFEYVIIDGASKDGSVDIVSSLIKDTDIKIIFISEKDSGIYNAMNKGIQNATGEYLLFLNSGDIFHSNDIIEKFIRYNPKSDVVAGKEFFTSDGFIYTPPTSSELNYDYLMHWPLMHQSTFIKRESFNVVGLYNENYRIVSDWEWWIRSLIIHNCTYETLDFIVADFDETGVSNSEKQRELHNEERLCVQRTLLPRVHSMYNELERLRKKNIEYKYLCEGKFNWIIKIILKIKQYKQ